MNQNRILSTKEEKNLFAVNWKKKKKDTKPKQKGNSCSCRPWGGQSAEKFLSASAKRMLKQNWTGQWKQPCSTTAYSPQLPVWAKNWDKQEPAHQLGRTLKQEPRKLQQHRKNLNNNQNWTVQQKRILFLEKVKYKRSQELGQWKGMPTIYSKLHSQSQTQTQTSYLLIIRSMKCVQEKAAMILPEDQHITLGHQW